MCNSLIFKLQSSRLYTKPPLTYSVDNVNNLKREHILDVDIHVLLSGGFLLEM